ncbi:DUF6338 family protein [Streptacidiphilus sp. P02-A3a]|uniref:DUF6338 family protein n=1 Tax=Streptacidiphilus sp. P02-A3a TaxID=2704468 RepID=UPI0015FDC514|nr:DUF6338 family protein [Streptacidiphilus sp. P02-A3a]QMU72926.1 hypothetical protein GXP74_36475 [Streptacidiphilus sp. P02-A3a]
MIVTIPDTQAQLLIVLMFVLPGAVFQAARSRLRGPTPSDQNATTLILRALSVSTFLNALYLALFGSALVRLYRTAAGVGTGVAHLGEVRAEGFIALALLFLVPSALAAADYGRTRVPWVALPNWLGQPAWWSHLRVAYDSTPQAWDFSFVAREPCFVRVLTEGKWLGGWYGLNSYSSSYPESRQLYLETAWQSVGNG